MLDKKFDFRGKKVAGKGEHSLARMHSQEMLTYQVVNQNLSGVRLVPQLSKQLVVLTGALKILPSRSVMVVKGFGRIKN